jgi:hypothetical protein
MSNSTSSTPGGKPHQLPGYPSVDQAYTRDFGLLFAEPSGCFSEGNRYCTSIVETMEAASPQD